MGETWPRLHTVESWGVRYSKAFVLGPRAGLGRPGQESSSEDGAAPDAAAAPTFSPHMLEAFGNGRVGLALNYREGDTANMVSIHPVLSPYTGLTVHLLNVLLSVGIDGGLLLRYGEDGAHPTRWSVYPTVGATAIGDLLVLKNLGVHVGLRVDYLFGTDTSAPVDLPTEPDGSGGAGGASGRHGNLPQPTGAARLWSACLRGSAYEHYPHSPHRHPSHRRSKYVPGGTTSGSADRDGATAGTHYPAPRRPPERLPLRRNNCAKCSLYAVNRGMYLVSHLAVEATFAPAAWRREILTTHRRAHRWRDADYLLATAIVERPVRGASS